jgi:hypothetical protein
MVKIEKPPWQKVGHIFDLIIFVLKGEENKMKDWRVNVANQRID